MTPNPLQILELRADNVKRLKSVRIHPDGTLVVLGGRNGQGKTSVLDAIAMALGGKDQIPSQPIRRGADRAEIVVDLGDLIVRRTFTAGGGQLVVQNRDGARFSSPQTMLDNLVGKLTFDPLAFSRESPKRQAEVLRDLLGLDHAALDQERATLYGERTATNKRAAALRHQFEAMPHHDGVPAEPIAAGAAAEQLRQAQEHNRELAGLRRSREITVQVVQEGERSVQDLRRRLQEAEAQLETARAQLAELSDRLAGTAEIDVAPLQAAIAQVDQTNAKVRDNQRRAESLAQVEQVEQASRDLTAKIDAIDQQKTAAIAAAKMPVEGLGFDDSGTVTFGGLPLDQASQAERIRVSVAIGIAMNPRLRVLLIRDASLLDADSLAMVCEMARDAGAQVWLERVERDQHTTVVIEDGEAHEVVPAAQEAAAE